MNPSFPYFTLAVAEETGGLSEVQAGISAGQSNVNHLLVELDNDKRFNEAYRSTMHSPVYYHVSPPNKPGPQQIDIMLGAGPPQPGAMSITTIDVPAVGGGNSFSLDLERAEKEAEEAAARVRATSSQVAMQQALSQQPIFPNNPRLMGDAADIAVIEAEWNQTRENAQRVWKPLQAYADELRPQYDAQNYEDSHILQQQYGSGGVYGSPPPQRQQGGGWSSETELQQRRLKAQQILQREASRTPVRSPPPSAQQQRRKQSPAKYVVSPTSNTTTSTSSSSSSDVDYSALSPHSLFAFTPSPKRKNPNGKHGKYSNKEPIYELDKDTQPPMYWRAEMYGDSQKVRREISKKAKHKHKKGKRRKKSRKEKHREESPPPSNSGSHCSVRVSNGTATSGSIGKYRDAVTSPGLPPPQTTIIGGTSSSSSPSPSSYVRHKTRPNNNNNYHYASPSGRCSPQELLAGGGYGEHHDKNASTTVNTNPHNGLIWYDTTDRQSVTKDQFETCSSTSSTTKRRQSGHHTPPPTSATTTVHPPSASYHNFSSTEGGADNSTFTPGEATPITPSTNVTPNATSVPPLPLKERDRHNLGDNYPYDHHQRGSPSSLSLPTPLPNTSHQHQHHLPHHYDGPLPPDSANTVLENIRQLTSHPTPESGVSPTSARITPSPGGPGYHYPDHPHHDQHFVSPSLKRLGLAHRLSKIPVPGDDAYLDQDASARKHRMKMHHGGHDDEEEDDDSTLLKLMSGQVPRRGQRRESSGSPRNHHNPPAASSSTRSGRTSSSSTTSTSSYAGRGRHQARTSKEPLSHDMKYYQQEPMLNVSMPIRNPSPPSHRDPDYLLGFTDFNMTESPSKTERVSGCSPYSSGYTTMGGTTLSSTIHPNLALDPDNTSPSKPRDIQTIGSPTNSRSNSPNSRLTPSRNPRMRRRDSAPHQTPPSLPGGPGGPGGGARPDSPSTPERPPPSHFVSINQQPVTSPSSPVAPHRTHRDPDGKPVTVVITPKAMDDGNSFIEWLDPHTYDTHGTDICRDPNCPYNWCFVPELHSGLQPGDQSQSMHVHTDQPVIHSQPPPPMPSHQPPPPPPRPVTPATPMRSQTSPLQRNGMNSPEPSRDYTTEPTTVLEEQGVLHPAQRHRPTAAVVGHPQNELWTKGSQPYVNGDAHFQQASLPSAARKAVQDLEALITQAQQQQNKWKSRSKSPAVTRNDLDSPTSTTPETAADDAVTELLQRLSVATRPPRFSNNSTREEKDKNSSVSGSSDIRSRQSKMLDTSPTSKYGSSASTRSHSPGPNVGILRDSTNVQQPHNKAEAGKTYVSGPGGNRQTALGTLLGVEGLPMTPAIQDIEDRIKKLFEMADERKLNNDTTLASSSDDLSPRGRSPPRLASPSSDDDPANLLLDKLLKNVDAYARDLNQRMTDRSALSTSLNSTTPSSDPDAVWNMIGRHLNDTSAYQVRSGGQPSKTPQTGTSASSSNSVPTMATSAETSGNGDTMCGNLLCLVTTNNTARPTQGQQWKWNWVVADTKGVRVFQNQADAWEPLHKLVYCGDMGEPNCKLYGALHENESAAHFFFGVRDDSKFLMCGAPSNQVRASWTRFFRRFMPESPPIT